MKNYLVYAVREMYWDEDNRLMVLSDNGKTSRYTYNHAGDVAPLQLATHITDEIIIDKIKSVFTKERTIVNIKPTTVINEFNNEK
jgi:hypothetical protein